MIKQINKTTQFKSARFVNTDDRNEEQLRGIKDKRRRPRAHAAGGEPRPAYEAARQTTEGTGGRRHIKRDLTLESKDDGSFYRSV